jgi:bifunctional DNA-binding transcriptional regulator/antitoxin component of YhaV-PrlF toxin-antitoxin module
MPIVKLGEIADITLPEEVREALKLKPGDLLQTEVVGNAVVLRPMDKADAKDKLTGLIGSAEWAGPGPAPSEDELMEMAVETVKTVRQGRREGGN